MTELDELQSRWETVLEAELPSVVALRHRVHADPRASGDEENTALVVRRWAAAWGSGWRRPGARCCSRGPNRVRPWCCAPSLHDELFLPPDAATGHVTSALIAGYPAAVEA